MYILSVLLTGFAGAVSVFAQQSSPLGTLETPQLPDFLKSNPLPDGFPWGTRSVAKTNPKSDPPYTGVTRYYDWEIARGKASPDGYQKDVLLINGQFPGPTIEANWGDWIEGRSYQLQANCEPAEFSNIVKLQNSISNPEEGTALHWHGLLQKATPWYDGVPSVSQCPISPGKSFTYRFRADLYGTSWYHSHYSAQYAGGLFGPMVIYGPKHIPYDIDLGPVLLSDWFHKDYFTVVEAIVGNNASNWPQASNNNLINGRNNFNCSSVTNGTPCFNNAGLSKFRFRAGKVHKLRLVNAGAAGLQKFSIDGHMLTVIANDYVAIKPYNTSVVTLGIGQRSDVLVTATGNRNGSYYMRSSQPTIPCARAEYPNALAVILYDNATKDSIPTSSPQPAGAPDPTCSNDDLSLTTPFYPMTPDPNPAVTQTIVVNQGVNASGHQVYTMDGSTFHANYNHPLLLLANEKNTSYPSDPQWNVYNFGNNGSVRIVVYNNNSSPHPMHLHGHDMYILSAGEGPWDGTTIINPQNPQRRDVQNLSPHGHLVMQFEADNPGVWPFHCHIAWHLSMGFYVNFLERPDDITQMQIPMVMAQTCTDWEAYSSKNVVLQIDDGV